MAKRELELLIGSLEQQGIFEDFFEDVESLQKKDPRSLEDLFPEFFTEFEEKIQELTPHLSEADVNYAMVQDLTEEIKDSAETYGCTRLANYSQDLWDACAAKNKEECLQLFDSLKGEYYAEKRQLTRIAKLHSQIDDEDEEVDEDEDEQAGK